MMKKTVDTIIGIWNSILWKESPRSSQKKEWSNHEFDLRVSTGHQKPLFELTKNCPQCNGAVKINRLFPECIFCGYDFNLDWEEEYFKYFKK